VPRSRARSLARARNGRPLKLPDFVAELIERVAFEAREDKRVDRRSGFRSGSDQRYWKTWYRTRATHRHHEGKDSRPPHLGHLRALARDHGQTPSSSTRASPGPRIDRQRPDPARRRQDRSSPGGRRQRGRHRPLVRRRWALKISIGRALGDLPQGASAFVPGLLDLVDQVGLAGKKDRAPWSRRARLVLEGLVAEKRILAQRGARLRSRASGAEGAGVRQDRRRTEPLPVSGRSAVEYLLGVFPLGASMGKLVGGRRHCSSSRFRSS